MNGSFSPVFSPVLIAGLMMGTGVGLIAARTLPGTSDPTSAVAQPTASPYEPLPLPPGYSNLLSPQQPPLQLGDSLDRTPSVDSRSLDARTMSSPPQPPRLLPQGDASPVKTDQTEPVEMDTNSVQSDPAAAQSTQLSDFRQQLQDLAPDFTDTALDELEQIRRVIETDTDFETAEPLPKPAVHEPVASETTEKPSSTSAAQDD